MEAYSLAAKIVFNNIPAIYQPDIITLEQTHYYWGKGIYTVYVPFKVSNPLKPVRSIMVLIESPKDNPSEMIVLKSIETTQYELEGKNLGFAVEELFNAAKVEDLPDLRGFNMKNWQF